MKIGFTIRQAAAKDAHKICELLYAIADVHAKLRPDLFKPSASKYSIEELCEKFLREDERVFVCVDPNDEVVGYVFCAVIEKEENNVRTKIKTLYVDDLCVDENYRGQGIATELMNKALFFAKEIGCYNFTLNVWAGNIAAERFYEKFGLRAQCTHLEMIL